MTAKVKLWPTALICVALSADTFASKADYDLGVEAFNNEDYSAAFELFSQSAEKGTVEAQTYLGLMYLNGSGVRQDDAEALKWFRAAAEQGYAGAQYNLGTMYAHGKGIPQDDWETVRWYRKAAEQGLGFAQVKLGLMYRDGKGVPKDAVQAYRWFHLAEINGEEGAGDYKEDIAAILTEDQIEEAEQDSRAENPQDTAVVEKAQELEPLDERSLVERAQQELARLGYEVGPIDGVMGKRTLEALNQFHRDRQISPKGDLTEDLRRLLENAR
ncbi:MAG: SEL1-like repeat protein [Candidatus Thiodiazotropha sp.]